MSGSTSSNTPIPTIAAPEMRVTTRAAEGRALSTSRAPAPTARVGHSAAHHVHQPQRLAQVVQNEVDKLLPADPDQRQAQLDTVHDAFIPWLATINPDNDQPVPRLAPLGRPAHHQPSPHPGDGGEAAAGSRLAEAGALAVKPGFRDRLDPTRDYILASRTREHDRLHADKQ